MSFGNSLRTGQQTSGKPVIFWQQQAMDANKRKPAKNNKFAREQKHPLRGKAEAAAPPALNPRRGPNPRNKRPNAKGTEISPGVVTLTQEQLDAILSTVGSLVNQNDELKKSQNKQGVDGLTADTNVLRLGNDAPGEENILNLKDSSRRASKPKPQELHGDTNGVVPRYVEPLDVPGLGSLAVGDMKIVEPGSISGLGPVDNKPAPPAAVPKAPLTQAEKKRLQWEKERADADAALLNMGSPLFGVGSRKPPNQLNALGASKPATPKAHLTKAEMRRRNLEDARNMPLSPGRTFSDFWSNEPKIKVAPPHDAATEPEFHHPGLPRTHLTKAELKREQWDQEKAENAARDAIGNRLVYNARAPVDHYQTSPSHPPPAPVGRIPKAHMSKAELKRAQWEQEKAEQQQDFNPWGRPGAGAPIRDANGQVLSDFNQRKVRREPEHSPTELGAKPMQSQWRY